MKHTKEKLLYLARQVLKNHSAIACQILSEFTTAKNIYGHTDLLKIKPYFVKYCQFASMDPDKLKPFSRYESEQKKIFVCGITKVFGEIAGLNKTLEEIVCIKQNVHYRLRNEIKFRYERDGSFKQSVDLLIKNIQDEHK